MYTISKHAKERYAERIMDKDEKREINLFILEHEEKIQKDIEKMIEFGELVFTGKPTVNYNRETCRIYINGTWVIVVDHLRNNVITLYSIDLGIGKEFNDEYISKLKAKIEKQKADLEDKMRSINVQKETYEQLINENNSVIEENKRINKSLMEQNESYENIIADFSTNIRVAEDDIRSTVATLIGKKVF